MKNKKIYNNNSIYLDFTKVSPDNPQDLYNIARICLKNLSSEVTLLKTCDPAISDDDILHNAIVGILEAFKKESSLKKKFLKMQNGKNGKHFKNLDSIFRYNLFIAWVRARLFSSFNQNNFSRLIIYENGKCEELTEKEFLRKKKYYKKLEKENKIIIVSCRRTVSFEDLNTYYENRSPEETLHLQNPEIATDEYWESYTNLDHDSTKVCPDYSTDPEEILIRSEMQKKQTIAQLFKQLMIKQKKENKT